MKPELKALWKAILDTPVGDPGGLHWRGDELWCGPIYFGVVYGSCPYFAKYYENGCETDGYSTRDKARAALEAAARDQISDGSRSREDA